MADRPKLARGQLDLDRVTHDVGVVRRAFAGRNADAVGASPCVDLGVVLEAFPILCDGVGNGCADTPQPRGVVFFERELTERPSGSAPHEQRPAELACLLGVVDSGFGAMNVERELHSFAGYGEQRRQMRRLEQRLGWRLVGPRNGSGAE